MRISDWSSDVCSSDLHHLGRFTSHESPVTNRAIKSARARAEFGAAEEVRDLVLRVVEAVRTVNRVLVDRVGEVGANRAFVGLLRIGGRSEEHTSELQSLMRISYAVFRLNTKNNIK